MARVARGAVFLDRDGTLIEDRRYLASPEGVALLPGTAEAVARLNRAGVPVLLVTNQSGIGRGYFSERDFAAVQTRLVELLAARGARLDGVYHCPHAPDHSPPCDCRKPAAGLFRRAALDHGIDLARSFFVGDRLRDVTPALELGGRGILVATGPEVEEESPPEGVVCVATLSEAVEHVLSHPSVD